MRVRVSLLVELACTVTLVVCVVLMIGPGLLRIEVLN